VSPREGDDQRPDETQEFELEPEPLDEARDDEESKPEPESVDRAGDDEREAEEHDEEGSELEELIAAETQEWDGPEAAEGEAPEEPEEEPEEEEPEDEPEEEEAEGEEPAAEAEPTQAETGGSSAPPAEPPRITRVRQAREKITSGFEALPGRGKVSSGFRRLRRWRPGFPVWLRFTTASLLIVASIATATAASLILYLGDIASALKDQTGALAGVDKFLTKVPSSGPQTILILGSDKDPELKDVQKGFKGLSDTTMLLRLDPDRDAIALYSLPRDLKVEIPGVGTDKLNAAYAYGGPQLTLQTVEALTGLEVNHLVNVDFEGFARAVNALDCVYVDVDRRYFHSNDSTPAEADYEEIDLQPGYQALCGFDALDYARYRHTDNDVVRAARQQEFLREARAKIPPERLFRDRKELITIFTEHTTSDINDPATMLQVLKLFLDSRDDPIKEIHFEGTLGPSFVTATPQEIKTATDQFLGVEATSKAGQTAAPEGPVTPEAAPDQTPVAPATGKKKAPPPSPGDGPVDNSFSLTPTSYGKELARSMRRRVRSLPIYYPTALETGSDFAQKPRVYKVNGTGEGSPPLGERAAYKWVFSRPLIGEYYGFMATRWTDPPILDDPDSERTIGDRSYKIYYDGDRVRMIAWQTDQGSFWLSNTLIESLSNKEMLRVAEGMKGLPARRR
jgi:polyisoprenyl-teichoic acid--peptidoglycan teichoic acid transferase